jgi:hypothetical protein
MTLPHEFLEELKREERHNQIKDVVAYVILLSVIISTWVIWGSPELAMAGITTVAVIWALMHLYRRLR